MTETTNSADVRPFQISIPEEQLDDLRDRLARTRWPDQLPDVGWAYGMPLDYLMDLADYWRSGYDWRKYEAAMNQLSQFTTTIDGANVHFLHVRSPERGALPLVMTHGWPGSVAEFTEIIGPLTDPGGHGGDPADAFDLVIPSIPGFGFSGPTSEAGWDQRRVARAFSELMARLGYERYGAQGGDVGAFVSPEIGAYDREHVVGVHVNALVTFPSGDPGDSADLTAAEQARLKRMENFQQQMMGYAMIQGTRPQTLAYGLMDSPAGQLAWIVEKFKEWTDPSLGFAENPANRDRILTNVMLYWLTGTVGSSARLYCENLRSGAAFGLAEPSTTPTGVAVFTEDIAIRRFAERTHKNIVHWSEFDRGGHFAAMEAPDLLVGDMRTFFRRFR